VIVLGGWNFRKKIKIPQTFSGFVAELFVNLTADLEIWRKGAPGS
jgi:hypothetical protein